MTETKAEGKCKGWNVEQVEEKKIGPNIQSHNCVHLPRVHTLTHNEKNQLRYWYGNVADHNKGKNVVYNNGGLKVKVH
jgi:hypothetical protein